MNRDKLKDIYKKYDLEQDDIFILKFGSKEKPIITRSGIERIQNKEKIQLNFKIEKISEDQKSCIMLAHGVIMTDHPDKNGQLVPKVMAQSFGEVSPENNKSNYPIAICEKRAAARVILKLANLIGFYSEDESEDFKK
tara:strand:- start:3723 stop:4136 length:414 start_codon:yes stop_codon:yes gene_type:complete